MITADQVDDLIRVTDFLRYLHGTVYTVKHRHRVETTGQPERVIEVHIPLSFERHASLWHYYWTLTKALWRAA